VQSLVCPRVGGWCAHWIEICHLRDCLQLFRRGGRGLRYAESSLAWRFSLLVQLICSGEPALRSMACRGLDLTTWPARVHSAPRFTHSIASKSRLGIPPKARLIQVRVCPESIKRENADFRRFFGMDLKACSGRRYLTSADRRRPLHASSRSADSSGSALFFCRQDATACFAYGKTRTAVGQPSSGPYRGCADPWPMNRPAQNMSRTPNPKADFPSKPLKAESCAEAATIGRDPGRHPASEESLTVAQLTPWNFVGAKTVKPKAKLLN